MTRSARAAVASSSSPSGVDFAGSDSALADDELTGAQDRCGGPDNLIEIPVYISPIAIIFNLPGVDNLQLSPETAAKIFNQKITNWNDPAIAADNPDAKLPDQRISPVNRSDESGTTGELHRLAVAGGAEGLDRTRPTATGPSRAARPPRARPASSTPSRTARARSATPTRARPASSASPRSRSAASSSARRPRRPPRSSTSPRRARTRASSCSRTSSTARSRARIR